NRGVLRGCRGVDGRAHRDLGALARPVSRGSQDRRPAATGAGPYVLATLASVAAEPGAGAVAWVSDDPAGGRRAACLRRRNRIDRVRAWPQPGCGTRMTWVNGTETRC